MEEFTTKEIEEWKKLKVEKNLLDFLEFFKLNYLEKFREVKLAFEEMKRGN